ncbi:MAG: M23 family metallopeptidase [Bacteroidota bacterium]|nr:M23 family metallopeptidase [Bacteroidota bacterium]
MKKRHIKFYYSDENLQIQEIKWFRTKIFGTIIGSILLGLTLLLIANYTFNNFFGLGNTRIKAIVQQNRMLQDQLTAFADRTHELENTLSKLTDQGNQLRLLVDLPTLDAETRSAGTGGAIGETEFTLDSDNSSLVLQSTQKILQKLSSEMKVQEQSYKQIVEKHEMNKGYFAALPTIKPMTGFYSRREFGMRMHPVLGVSKKHEGIDIVNDVGTPVIATGDGTVQLAGHSGSGFGIVVVINHGYGYQTVYAHLSKILVRNGQRVKRGDVIAKSGRSGLVSGPHLHYEVRRNGVYLNPMDFFFDNLDIISSRKQIASR